MNFNFIGEKDPDVPNGFWQAANRAAGTWRNAEQSLTALESQIRLWVNRPSIRKVLSASPGLILLSLLLTGAYFAVGYWEWEISKEIYEVLISASVPWLPFLGCMGVALYVSSCLGESSRHFSILTSEENVGQDRNLRQAEAARARLFGRRVERDMASGWFFHPITGIAVGIVFLFGIYLASRLRVELLNAAGEQRGEDFQIWLPVVLYGVEILLGIPAVYIAKWGYLTIRQRLFTKALTSAKDDEDDLRQIAISLYSDYMTALAEYNPWAERQGKPSRPLLPPGAALQALLVQEWRYDPTTGAHPEPRSNGSSQPNGSGTAPGTNGTSPGNSGQGAVSGNGGGSREEDLLNLLDEQINRQNRGL